MIGYDDEWFAKEIRVELCETIHDRQCLTFHVRIFYADCVGVSVFNANATGLLSCGRHAPKLFCGASTSRTVSFSGW